MSTIRLNSSSLRLNSSSVRFLIAATATPSIGIIACYNDTGGGNVYIEFDVTNNDSSSATIEVSTSSTFAFIDDTGTVASGASGTFQINGVINPPGSTTVYARARATGKANSTTASRTQTINGCFAF
jgi:hypothetical protein